MTIPSLFDKQSLQDKQHSSDHFLQSIPLPCEHLAPNPHRRSITGSFLSPIRPTSLHQEPVHSLCPFSGREREGHSTYQRLINALWSLTCDRIAKTHAKPKDLGWLRVEKRKINLLSTAGDSIPGSSLTGRWKRSGWRSSNVSFTDRAQKSCCAFICTL